MMTRFGRKIADFRLLERCNDIWALFCDITQRRVAIPCRRFGTTYRSHLEGSTDCPETSVSNCHSSLRAVLGRKTLATDNKLLICVNVLLLVILQMRDFYETLNVR